MKLSTSGMILSRNLSGREIQCTSWSGQQQDNEGCPNRRLGKRSEGLEASLARTVTFAQAPSTLSVPVWSTYSETQSDELSMAGRPVNADGVFLLEEANDARHTGLGWIRKHGAKE